MQDFRTEECRTIGLRSKAMDPVSKYLALMERKRERLIRNILGGHTKRCASPPTKVLNTKMIASKKDLNYEEC